MSFFTKLPERLYAPSIPRLEPGETFCRATARALAWMSQLAYETDEPAKMARILGRWDSQLVGVLNATVGVPLPVAATCGFVAQTPDALVIAFAGTDPIVLANWITDFDARLDSHTGVAIGYQTAAESVYGALDVMLRDQVKPLGRLYVTGHSLGGALAALVARRLEEAGTRLHAVYTFGMPRIGSSDYGRSYDLALGARTHRLVHGEDIVPTVAPSGLGFRHVGCYRRCESGGTFDERVGEPGSDEPGFVEGLSRELRGALRRPIVLLQAAFHRAWLAMRLVFGAGPPGIRTDIGGIAIELLPARLRDHMPDRYIAGCRGMDIDAALEPAQSSGGSRGETVPSANP